MNLEGLVLSTFRRKGLLSILPPAVRRPHRVSLAADTVASAEPVSGRKTDGRNALEERQSRIPSRDISKPPPRDLALTALRLPRACQPLYGALARH
jgi:hypothetical protein